MIIRKLATTAQSVFQVKSKTFSLLKMATASTATLHPTMPASTETPQLSTNGHGSHRSIFTHAAQLCVPNVAVPKIQELDNRPELPVQLEIANAEDTLTIQQGSEKLEIPLIWLRDSCTCQDCVDGGTNQRRSWTIWMDAKLKEAKLLDGTIVALWTDGHRSRHQLDDVIRKFRPDRVPPLVTRDTWNRQTWSGQMQQINRLPVSTYEEVLTESGIQQLLTSIHRYGFGLVNNCEPTEDATETLIRRVGPPMPTTFSPGMWTFTSNMAREDTAYSNEYLAPHTDNTYFANPARIQVFHCIERGADCAGGESILVDGFQCADKLQRDNPTAFNMLCSVAQECLYVEPKICYKWADTVFSHSKVDQSLLCVRFNMYDRSRSPPFCPTKEASNFYASVKEFADLTQQRNNQLMITLVPGVVVFFDNWRVLHGRTAFTGKRVMTGCYIDNDEFNHACRKYKVIY